MSYEFREFECDDLDLNNKTILITGGTGSFGKLISTTILNKWKPKRLIILSRDELKQSEMADKSPWKNHDCVRFFIGNVREYERLEMAFRGVDYVIHAAALKQVTTAEYNPFECIRTNVIGAENVVRAALHNNVQKVIALSTDKASNPGNLYGASKLASDKIMTAANHLAGAGGTRFAVVRYGNVMGSRGSVVPLFDKLITDGIKKLPITDDRMTRFWITLQQGVNFVLSSLTIMKGGEIFIPKIPSIHITDLAKAMDPNIDMEIVGIRPGEKLHESMISSDDARTSVDLGDRYAILPAVVRWSDDKHHVLTKTHSYLDDGFVYASNNNSEWLSVEDLKFWLKKYYYTS